jgi:hypothetical protein
MLIATSIQRKLAMLVQLKSPAAVHYRGGINGIPATASDHGRFDPSSKGYVAYRKHLDNEHVNFRAALGKNAPGATVVKSYRITANALAFQLNGESSGGIGEMLDEISTEPELAILGVGEPRPSN